MILRKPYAFLIKYFKFIHILLFLMCGFLLFKLRSIYIFFQGYVKTDTYTYISDIASKYIGLPMFIVTILILISALLILFLMKEKEKPVLFYRILVLYAFSLLISLIVYNNFFVSLEFELYDRGIISIYRDVIGILYYIIYFFIALTFVRGFGFDIKKFSFDRDLKLLNISESDNEEFELNVSVDKENIRNTVRREKRFFIYFLKENALILSIMLVIILLITGGVLYNNIALENVVYKQGEVVVANNIEYLVNKTYLTNKDKQNNELDSYYLIIDFTFHNQKEENTKIELTKTRLNIGNKYYYPVLNRYDLFNDLGTGYNKETIKGKTTYKNYLLVFKLDENITNKENAYLEVFDKDEYKNSELKVKRERMLLEVSLFEDKKEKNYYLNEQFSLEDSILKKGIIRITNYEINNSFTHEYEECIDNDCNKYKKVIQSNKYLKILKLNYEISDLDFSNLDSYISLICLDENSNEVEIKLERLFNDNNTIYYELERDLNSLVPNNFKINIHSRVYLIKLK